MLKVFKKVFLFYYEGFKSMTVGRKLWLIIIVKLFIMFAILKLFFFPDFLKTNFKSDSERGDYVIEQITSPINNK
ncbi:MAG: DUF4492 domain-containing protein [Bacteroidetes bacterium]|nr:MAG: DUF4492 domain-containing protein [Bacteroidota bacterium]